MASPLPSSGDGNELDRLRTLVSSYFPVYETRVGPQSVVFAVHVDPASLESRFDAMRRDLWERRYVPILRRQGGEEFVEVIRRPTIKPFQQWVNVALLCGTVATTAFAGSLIWIAYVGGSALTWGDVAEGWLYFGLPVMVILGLHELAHYVVARHHHVEASLPYFIPVPPPFLFGTFGAFISIREPFPDKKVLFDIGAAGPLAGFAASIPIAIAGMYLAVHAPVLPLTYCGPTVLGVSYGNLLVGQSFFWTGLSLFFPVGVVALSPLALAGWVGLLVTAINLLPAGQLDGGHVFRALFGDRTRFVSYTAVVFLFGIGLLFYTGWLFFGILILFLGARHPPPLNDLSPLDVKRYALGAFVGAVLISGFVLTPIAAPAGAIALPGSDQLATYPAPPAGAAVAAALAVTIVNQDPVVHGFVVTASLTNVTVGNRSAPDVLSGAALEAWEVNTTWVFHFPNGTSVQQTGSSFSLPSSQYLSISGGGASAAVVIALSNPASAIGAGVAWQTSEFCATTGGSASTSFVLGWP
jgi:membrane-associated protease RseP (regulator of RpoE activity)